MNVRTVIMKWKTILTEKWINACWLRQSILNDSFFLLNLDTISVCIPRRPFDRFCNSRNDKKNKNTLSLLERSIKLIVQLGVSFASINACGFKLRNIVRLYKCIASSVLRNPVLCRLEDKNINHNFPYAYVNLLLIKKRREVEMELSNDRKILQKKGEMN